MDKKLIARRIRQYRHMEKISQEYLAAKVGVSDTYIRKLEAGVRTPSLEVVMALAEALNITPNDILLSVTEVEKTSESSLMELLNDCTHTEFSILYENMVELKELLRTYLK